MEQDRAQGLRGTLAVVVPCYNAGDRAQPVVSSLRKKVERVIVVDDGSTDGGVDGLEDLGVLVRRFAENRGKGFALIEGFRAALSMPEVGCAAVVDADGQHDPGELPRLYETFVREEADLLIGSRVFDKEHAPWRSRLGNKFTAAATRRLLRQPIPDTQSGFRIHSRRFIEAVVRDVDGGRYETEMEILVKAVREGYKVVSAPILTLYEEGNPSSHFDNVRDSIRVLRALFRSAVLKRGAEGKDRGNGGG